MNEKNGAFFLAGLIKIFIPPPPPGFPSPQSNDVDVDENGFMYLLDRNIGLDILKFDNNLKL